MIYTCEPVCLQTQSVAPTSSFTCRTKRVTEPISVWCISKAKEISVIKIVTHIGYVTSEPQSACNVLEVQYVFQLSRDYTKWCI